MTARLHRHPDRWRVYVGIVGQDRYVVDKRDDGMWHAVVPGGDPDLTIVAGTLREVRRTLGDRHTAYLAGRLPVPVPEDADPFEGLT